MLLRFRQLAKSNLANEETVILCKEAVASYRGPTDKLRSSKPSQYKEGLIDLNVHKNASKMYDKIMEKSEYVASID